MSVVLVGLYGTLQKGVEKGSDCSFRNLAEFGKTINKDLEILESWVMETGDAVCVGLCPGAELRSLELVERVLIDQFQNILWQ